MGQSLVDCNKSGKLPAHDKHFKYIGKDCLFSRYSSNLGQSVRLNAQQIDEGKERFLRRGKKNCGKRFK